MGTFTYYFHGTGRNRSHTHIGASADKAGAQEIIAAFGNVAKGEELKHYAILDGVGFDSYNKEVDLPEIGQEVTNPQPGSFNPHTKEKAPKDKRNPSSDGPLHSAWWLEKRGNAFGRGTTDNLMYALNVLRGWSADNEPSVAVLQNKCLNMIGWSRGAVNCIRLANKIAWHKQKNTKGFPAIDKINIFAVDPVAGGFIEHYKHDASYLDPIVKNFVGVLSLSDNRAATFRPMDLKRLDYHKAVKAGSNVVFLPFPGVHSDVASMQTRVPETGEIIFNLAYRFLTGWGSEFVGTPAAKLSNAACVERYSAMVAKIDGEYSNAKLKQGFGKAAAQSFGITGVRPHLNANKGKYTQRPAYFINEHHRILFEHQFPTVFKIHFGCYTSTTEMTALQGKYQREMRIMQGLFPKTHAVTACLGATPSQPLEKTVLLTDLGKLQRMKLAT